MSAEILGIWFKHDDTTPGASARQLAKLTAEYWVISYAYEGGPNPPENVSTGDALQRTNAILGNLGPSRFLGAKVSRLQDNLIETQPRKKKDKNKPIPKAKILLMPSR